MLSVDVDANGWMERTIDQTSVTKRKVRLGLAR